MSLCSDLVQPYNLKEDQQEEEEGGGGEFVLPNDGATEKLCDPNVEACVPQSLLGGRLLRACRL